MFALVTDGTIQAVTGRRPEIVHYANDDYPQGRDWDLRALTDEEAAPHLAAVGWYLVVDTDRPADTDTHTSDRSLVFDGDSVTETWTVREWTPEELTARQRAPFTGPEAMLAAVTARLLADQDVEDPPEYVQPTGAHDAYLPGAVVSYDGRRWRNDLPIVNVWPPGTLNAGWTDLDAPEPGENWAAGVLYAPGQEVLYNGVRYRCVQGHTSMVGWEPPNVPALWAVV